MIQLKATLSFLFCIVTVLHSVAGYAQQETDGSPQVLIDPTVLQDLTPPAPAPAPEPIESKPSTSISVDDVLHAGIANSSVITERNHSAVPAPAPAPAPAPVPDPSPAPSSLPVVKPTAPKPVYVAKPIIDERDVKRVADKKTPKPVTQKPAIKKEEPKKKEAPPPAPKPVEKKQPPKIEKSVEKKPDAEPVKAPPKIIPTPIEKPAEKPVVKPVPKQEKPKQKPKTEAQKNDFAPSTNHVPDALKERPKPVDAYRPKAPKTMPAVPSSKVERDILAPIPSHAAPMTSMGLPKLPPTISEKSVFSKPSIGERMMDAALENKIEDNPSVIKDILLDKKIKTAATKSSAKKSALPPPVTVPTAKQPENETGFKPAPAPKPFIPTPKNSIIFAPEQITLTLPLQFKIEDDILPLIKKTPQMKIQLLSFATTPDGTDTTAKRIGLSRALAVRDYLLVKEVDATKIEVHVLGNTGGKDNPDRVDVVFEKK